MLTSEPTALCAVDIIQAYDRIIIDLWGDALGRPWPHVKDKIVAERWLAAGATLLMCERVFSA
jgi:hypothetical protein